MLLHSPAGDLGVFLLCCLTSPQVTFLLVSVQDCLDLIMELLVYLLQTYRDVLMDCAFAYPEMLCR